MTCGCEQQQPRRLLIKSRANDRRGRRRSGRGLFHNLLDWGGNAMQRTLCVKFPISSFPSYVFLASFVVVVSGQWCTHCDMRDNRRLVAIKTAFAR